MDHKFLFISDFDGTISEQDFFLQIMDHCKPGTWDWVHQEFGRHDRPDYQVLNEIFTSMDLSREELDREITLIPVDPGFRELVDQVEGMGGDFIVLSAGCAYYIRPTLHAMGLSRIPVYASEGVYENRGMRIVPDPASPFHSDWYSIDKSKVVQTVGAGYDQVLYAGDSDPDLKPSLLADLRFAKGRLADLLEQRNADCVRITRLADITAYLRERF